MVLPVWHHDRFDRAPQNREVRSFLSDNSFRNVPRVIAVRFSNVACHGKVVFVHYDDYLSFLAVVRSHTAAKTPILGFLLTPVSYDVVIEIPFVSARSNGLPPGGQIPSMAVSVSQYVRWMNRRYHLKGTLWNREYQKSLIFSHADLHSTLEGFKKAGQMLNGAFDFPVMAHHEER